MENSKQNIETDTSTLRMADVMTKEQLKDRKKRLEDPENLCGTRYRVVRFNSQKGIYEELVLGIGKTEGASDFSKSKKGKIEMVGGKDFEYYGKDEKRVGTKNKMAVLKKINDRDGVDQLLGEFKEESGIRKDFVKRVKYMGTFSRDIEGVYAKDKRVKKKVTDLFIVEVPPYAEVKLNNPESDDDHNAYEWVPSKSIKEFVDSPSSKEILDELPKNDFPKIFEAIRGDVSEKVHKKITELFEYLNKDAELYKDLKKGVKRFKKNNIRSFVDFGRIDSVKLVHLKDIFFTAFELRESDQKNGEYNLRESLGNNFMPHLKSALDYEKNHRGVKYSRDFLEIISGKDIKSMKDVHDFIRGYSRHPKFKTEWKEWCLNLFKVAYSFKYAENSFPYFDKLDEYNEKFEDDVQEIVDLAGLKMRNPNNKKEDYDVYVNYGEPKAKWRVVDKIMTKKDFDFRLAKDLLRRRIVFSSKSAMNKFRKHLSKNNASKWHLEWTNAKNGTEKTIGKYPINDCKVPIEIQILMEGEFQNSETQERHHDVYVDLIKANIRDDRLEEISEEKIIKIYKKCLSNPEVLAGETKKIVGKKINKRLRDEFIRIPSIKNSAKFAYYSKTNLLNTVGQNLRADEDDFLGSLMRYMAKINDEKIDSWFDTVESEKDLFDKSLDDFLPKLMKIVPDKKRKTLEVYLRSKVRKSAN